MAVNRGAWHETVPRSGQRAPFAAGAWPRVVTKRAPERRWPDVAWQALASKTSEPTHDVRNGAARGCAATSTGNLTSKKTQGPLFSLDSATDRRASSSPPHVGKRAPDCRVGPCVSQSRAPLLQAIGLHTGTPAASQAGTRSRLASCPNQLPGPDGNLDVFGALPPCVCL